MVLLFLTLSGKFTTLLLICLYNMFYPSLYPLLFFPAHGKILAWAGRKIYPGREGNLKEYIGE